MDRFCDVLIVGCDISGLIAGTFLAKRGLSVMVLDSDESVEDRKKHIQPNLISHLDSLLFKNILGRLAISETELGIIHRYQDPYQVILPEHRIDVTTNRDRFYRELKREFPDQAEAIFNFYLNLDTLDRNLDSEKFRQLLFPKGFLKRFKWRRFIKENRLNLTLADWMEVFQLKEEVKAFIEAQIQLLSPMYCPVPFSYPLAKTLANDNAVLFDIKGGMRQLQKLFLRKIESYSGRVKSQALIENIEVEHRKIRHVSLAGENNQQITFRYLLWNQMSSQIIPLLPNGLLSRWLVRDLQKASPRFLRFSVEYELDPAIIPIGMRNNLLLVQNPQEPLLGSNFLHLHFYYPPEATQEENRYLIVSYLMEAKEKERDAARFLKVHQEITEALQKLMPFSGEKIRLVFPQMDEEGRNLLSLEVKSSDFDIFKQNAQKNPVYEVPAQSFQDLFPFPHQSAFKNLFFTGSEVLSALGFAGSLILGLKTVDRVWEDFEVWRTQSRRGRK